MNNFFIWCSGADKHTVLKCSSYEINKYNNIGMVVFFVALLASLSASYFVAFAFDRTTSPSLSVGYMAVGLLWGFIILSLDRSIVATISKEDSFVNQLIKASPRFVIAIFIGLVISTPLEMKIFEKEINEKLKVLIYDDKVSGTQKLIDSKKRLYTENVNQKESLINDRNFKYDQFQKELKGSVTGQIGYGKKSREYELAYLKTDSLLNLKTKAIDKIQSELDQLNNSVGSVLDVSEQDIATYAGVEKRVQALYSLNSFHWVITCLFILFEILPMIVKLLSPKGDYDAYIKSEKENFQLNILEDFNSNAEMKEMIRKLQQEKVLAQEKNKNDIENELKSGILKTLSEVQNEIAMKRIEIFKEKSLNSLIEMNSKPNVLVENHVVSSNSPLTTVQQTRANQNNYSIIKRDIDTNSPCIKNPKLEEIFWKGNFINEMSVEFIFYSDRDELNKELYYKCGSIIKKNSSWRYSGNYSEVIEIMDNGNIIKLNFSVANGKLSLKEIKTKNEYEFQTI